ncbi:uncharacterized protein EDB91DRAFT_1206726, partial [Suillus paluster]|uniref:uncharacterized protein n=1 Tax=Suillus paluster TaxID=48578 RepID=UPI001B8796EF
MSIRRSELRTSQILYQEESYPPLSHTSLSLRHYLQISCRFSTMKESELYCQVMQGVNVHAAMAAFWANNPSSSVSSSVCQSVAQSLQVSRTRLPRPPRASSSITPSEHRLHVLASDRLLVWSTPAGQEWQAELEKNFPNASLFHLFQVMIRSLDQDTHSNYSAGLLRFMQFCNSINVP